MMCCERRVPYPKQMMSEGDLQGTETQQGELHCWSRCCLLWSPSSSSAAAAKAGHMWRGAVHGQDIDDLLVLHRAAAFHLRPCRACCDGGDGSGDTGHTAQTEMRGRSRVLLAI